MGIDDSSPGDPDDNPAATLGAGEIARRVQAGELLAERVAERTLAAIDADGGRLGAWLTVSREPLLEAARAIDQRRARGERLGRLAGVPLAIKDALATRDLPTTAASAILLRRIGPSGPDPRDGYRPPEDATVVARLRAEDALIVGKTNMDELAMGSSNENSAFFPARNPHDPSRTPGGSSGGSAVAVAAGMATLALGSDTGGSIRQPAALTGVIGIKPTYGRVSRYGLFAFASSLDQVGVFGRDARGAARGLEAIAGACERDATCADRPVEPYALACDRGVAGLRVGIPDEYFVEGVEPGVRDRVRGAIERLSELGCELVPIELPSTRYAVATYYVLATAEASSNLARYDGVRFGLRASEPNLLSLYQRTRGMGFGDEVKRRIILGTFVLSSGYYDAYYLRAQKARTLSKRDFERAFERVDLIATPTSPTVAFPLGARTADPLSMYLADICTLPASLAGLPAISVPCGSARPDGGGPELPVGLQLIAPAFAEGRLFAAAAALEGTPGG